MAKSPVPDFTSWKLIERKSFFYAPNRPDFLKKSPDEGDGENPFWCGYETTYEDPSGSADGIAIEIFGYGQVLKIWGLKTEEYYNGYAILRGKDWEFFSGKDYVGVLTTVFRNKDKKPISVFACAVRILDRRRADAEVIRVVIPRDLTGLPPTDNK
ncbi:MAG: hypothetical protein G01um10143_791 [Parcubacteria group bacterium Gr01-1014_3]|nr:MAG: hypothetical protein G01um10143_791 [Parcubacteria group bacterium Gr01-1014_3]